MTINKVYHVLLCKNDAFIPRLKTDYSPAWAFPHHKFCNEYFILDEDELPEPLVQFESGYVKEALNVLTDTIHDFLPQMVLETETLFKQKEFFST